MIWWFGIGVGIGIPFGFMVALCRAAKLADEDVALIAGICEHPGCDRPWTAVVGLAPGKELWVCDLHVQPTVEAHVAPFEAFTCIEAFTCNNHACEKYRRPVELPVVTGTYEPVDGRDADCECGSELVPADLAHGAEQVETRIIRRYQEAGV